MNCLECRQQLGSGRPSTWTDDFYHHLSDCARCAQAALEYGLLFRAMWEPAHPEERTTLRTILDTHLERCAVCQHEQKLKKALFERHTDAVLTFVIFAVATESQDKDDDEPPFTTLQISRQFAERLHERLAIH